MVNYMLETYFLLFLDFVTRMSVSMITAVRSSRITKPHIVPVMIISMSEPEFETRIDSAVSWLEVISLSVGVLPVATEAIELDENSLPVAPSGEVVLSTRDPPVCINEVMPHNVNLLATTWLKVMPKLSTTAQSGFQRNPNTK